MTMLRRLLSRPAVACSMLLAATGLLVSQPTPAAAEQAASPEKPEKDMTILQERSDRVIAELPNRMILIAQELPTAPVVSAQVWVKTGSIYEQEHVGAGLSHFLEHLLSGGTTSTRTEAESNAILGQIGAAVNAATSLDNVHYYINTTREHTDTAVSLLSDWIMNAEISPAEYERERSVIQQEFSKGQGEPGRIFWKLTQQARYTAHPARHPTIGYLDEFLDVSRDEIYDFYKRMYVPNNMVFVVTGDIDKDAVVQQLAELWGDVPAGELPELSFPVEPEIDSPRTLSARADIERPRVRLAWPGTQLAEAGDYELDLLAMILGQGEASRLVRSVRDQQGLATSVNAYNASFPWGRGFFGIDAEAAVPAPEDPETDLESWRQQHLDALRQALLAEVERIREAGVSDQELSRAKRKVLAQVTGANQTAEGIASTLASDTIGMGDPDYLSKYAQRIQDVSAEQVQQAAQQFLAEQRLITAQLLPLAEGESVEALGRPDEPAEELEQTPVELDNRQVVARLEKNVSGDDAAAPAVEVDEPVMYRLDNGLRVLVQRSTVVPSVAMHLYWKGGLLGEPAEQAGIANAMAMMMMRGTQKHSARELAVAIENLGAALSTSSGNNTTYATARSLSEDWPTVLGLLAEVVTQPTFPAEQWQRMRPRLLAAIDRQGDSWFGELGEAFRPQFFGDHPWARTPRGEKETVAALSAEDLAQFHAGQIAAEDAVLVVVGDIEPKKVRAEAERLFGELPGRTDGRFDPPVPAETEPGIEQVATSKPVAAVQIGFGPAVAQTHPDYPALQVLSRLMSNFPTGWLDQALRGEGPGLVYADWAYVQTGLVPGYFGITFNTAPATTPEALARAMAVVDRARTGPVGEAELAKAKAKVLTTEFFRRQSNADRAMQAGLSELYGLGDLRGEAFLAQVDELTPEDIRDVANRYLTEPVVTVLTAEPIPADQLEAAVSGEPVSASPEEAAE